MNLVDFLVTSRARKALLRTVLGDGAGGSVSELARRSRVVPSTADRELDRMEACGLVSTSRVGKEKFVRANLHRAPARQLRKLLALREAVPGRGRGDDERVRAALAHHGAPLFVRRRLGARDVPPLEPTVSRALRLAHSDPAVAGNLPVVLWRNRQRLDRAELVRLAVREGQGQTLGFLLELTDELAGETFFTPSASALTDRRVRKVRNFFSPDGRLSPHERELAVMNTPAVARRWHFLMNMSLESFASYFRKGTQPDVHLGPR